MNGVKSEPDTREGVKTVDEQKMNASPAEEEKSKELKEAEEKLDESETINKKIKHREKGVKQYQFFILRVAILLLILWLLFFVFIGLTRMPSGDMYPRIDAGDMVMFYRLDKSPKYGDIIVFRKASPQFPDAPMYVARVVAAGGDTVEVTDSGVIVNGNALVENNIFYRTAKYEGDGFPEYPITLEGDQCFVLVDFRNGGTDSRYFGPVEQDEILGTVITILRRNNL